MNEQSNIFGSNIFKYSLITGISILLGVLIAKGLANDGQVVEMIGSVVTFVGTIWSVLNKRA